VERAHGVEELPSQLSALDRGAGQEQARALRAEELVEAGGGLSAFGDLLEARTLVGAGLVNQHEFAAVVRRLMAAPASQERAALWAPVWRVLAAEAFVQRFGMEA